MPEIFRFYGYSFFFYSREHEPIHVHVEGNGGYAIYDFLNGTIKLRDAQGIKISDLRKIEQVIIENKQTIMNKWQEHFGRL
jgi:uncharacterized protein YdhG (YjbR/CyaY superfamily)